MIGYFLWIMGFIACGALLFGAFGCMMVAFDEEEWRPGVGCLILLVLFAILAAGMLTAAEDDPLDTNSCTVTVRGETVSSTNC